MQDRTDVTEQSAPGGGAAATWDGYRAGGLEGEFIWTEITLLIIDIFVHNDPLIFFFLMVIKQLVLINFTDYYGPVSTKYFFALELFFFWHKNTLSVQLLSCCTQGTFS